MIWSIFFLLSDIFKNFSSKKPSVSVSRAKSVKRLIRMCYVNELKTLLLNSFNCMCFRICSRACAKLFRTFNFSFIKILLALFCLLVVCKYNKMFAHSTCSVLALTLRNINFTLHRRGGNKVSSCYVSSLFYVSLHELCVYVVSFLLYSCRII